MIASRIASHPRIINKKTHNRYSALGSVKTGKTAILQLVEQQFFIEVIWKSEDSANGLQPTNVLSEQQPAAEINRGKKESVNSS